MKEEITCEINNQKIYGLTITPDNIEGKIPTVILCHGLTANYKRMMDCAELLKNYGIGSYIFDFRGGSDITISDGETEDMTVYSEVDDLNAVIDMVKTLDFVDTDKLYLLGHSQGGLVTALVANKRIDEINGLFLICPAFIIPEMSEELSGSAKISFDDSLSDWWFTTGKKILSKKYLKIGKLINLFDDINGFNKPVYIFHGNSDDIVPLSYSKTANEEYNNSKLMILDNEGHLFTNKGEQTIINKISEIINK